MVCEAQNVCYLAPYLLVCLFSIYLLNLAL